MARNGRYYRKIYKEFHGEIPVDSDGRPYDIHHLDGNVENNTPENLVALSIDEHYQVHYDQGDYGSAWAISQRMKISHAERSEIGKKAVQVFIDNGGHTDESKDKVRKYQQSKVDDGTHVFFKINKKENHPQYDHTIRIWKNIYSGEVVEMTNYQLRTTYNIRSAHFKRLIDDTTGRRKHVAGWSYLGIKQTNEE